ncbi:MAG TPA: substrate-binding domain-containing protein [Conexibacter sp.]|nr:substrate-binding domain-containing protein [Conexibacter sp.]
MTLPSEKDVRYGNPDDARLRLCSVTHDILGDPFWAVYRRGLSDAADALGVAVHHRAPERFSPELQAELLAAAVQEQPDGILATIPDAQAVDGPLRAAIGAGIPVIAVNAADPRPPAQRIPYLRYVGAEDRTGGRAAADRVLTRGTPRRALWIDHYLVDNACHVARGGGFAEALEQHGVPVERLRVTGEDHPGSVEAIATWVAAHPDLDALCTLGPPGCLAGIEALERTNRLSDVTHVSFDLAPAQLDAIRAGKLDCTLDSQQYLQGYLGVTLLTLYRDHGFLPAADVLTGPAPIDAGNVEQVLASVEAGVR